MWPDQSMRRWFSIPRSRRARDHPLSVRITGRMVPYLYLGFTCRSAQYDGGSWIKFYNSYITLCILLAFAYIIFFCSFQACHDVHHSTASRRAVQSMNPNFPNWRLLLHALRVLSQEFRWWYVAMFIYAFWYGSITRLICIFLDVKLTITIPAFCGCFPKCFLVAGIRLAFKAQYLARYSKKGQITWCEGWECSVLIQLVHHQVTARWTYHLFWAHCWNSYSPDPVGGFGKPTWGFVGFAPSGIRVSLLP